MRFPIRGYQDQNDAERDLQFLATRNIIAIIKEQQETGTPYLLSVEENDIEMARQLLQGQAEINSSGIVCEQCESRPATIHVTRFIEGNQTESHYCQQCEPNTR